MIRLLRRSIASLYSFRPPTSWCPRISTMSMFPNAYQPVIHGGNFVAMQTGNIHMHSHSVDSASGEHNPQLCRINSYEHQADIWDRLESITEEHCAHRIPRLRWATWSPEMPSRDQESDLEPDCVLDRGPRGTHLVRHVDVWPPQVLESPRLQRQSRRCALRLVFSLVAFFFPERRRVAMSNPHSYLPLHTNSPYPSPGCEKSLLTQSVVIPQFFFDHFQSNPPH